MEQTARITLTIVPASLATMANALTQSTRTRARALLAGTVLPATTTSTTAQTKTAPSMVNVPMVSTATSARALLAGMVWIVRLQVTAKLAEMENRARTAGLPKGRRANVSANAQTITKVLIARRPQQQLPAQQSQQQRHPLQRQRQR